MCILRVRSSNDALNEYVLKKFMCTLSLLWAPWVCAKKIMRVLSGSLKN
jgi:hypothetical protein